MVNPQVPLSSIPIVTSLIFGLASDAAGSPAHRPSPVLSIFILRRVETFDGVNGTAFDDRSTKPSSCCDSGFALETVGTQVALDMKSNEAIAVEAESFLAGTLIIAVILSSRLLLKWTILRACVVFVHCLRNTAVAVETRRYPTEYRCQLLYRSVA